MLEVGCEGLGTEFFSLALYLDGNRFVLVQLQDDNFDFILRQASFLQKQRRFPSAYSTRWKWHRPVTM